MARPSKKTLELRKKIIELNIFKRDSEIYTSFERVATIEKPTYLFSSLCSFRDDNNYGFYKKIYKALVKRYAGFIFKIDDNMEESLEDFYLFNELKIFENIASIDKILAETYLLNVIVCKRITKLLENHQDSKEPYYVINEIDSNLTLKILKKALSKERYNYYLDEYKENIRIDLLLKNGVFLAEPLTEQEIQKILKEISKYEYRIDKTIIIKTPTFCDINDLTDNRCNKNVFAELDLTKPKEEILEYVSKLKDNFDDDDSKFQNIYELLGEDQKVFNCNSKQCEIYKDTRSPKPISGRLTDILFIYDCKKVNEILGTDILTNEYIIDEINRYWIDIKNISNDKFHSLDEYYAIAKDYIDNKQYKDYLSGIEQ